MSSPAICFDARMAHASGIGTYIRGLLSEINRQQPHGNSPILLTDQEEGLPLPWRKIHVASRFYSPAEQITVPWAFRQSGATLLHVPHYNLPVVLASRCIVTIHDLIHLKFPKFLPSRLASVYAQTFFHQFVPRARAILTVSEHTKRDLIEMLNIPAAKITVTPPGVSEGYHRYSPSEIQSTLQSLGLQPGYFLFVGNLKEFKNVPRVLHAYQTLKQNHPDTPPMIFVGRNFIPGFDRLLQETPGVRWLPDLSYASLPFVYSGALALVFPSLYEGFGLPPLEAMACGTPVICSNRASLPEVVGDAAIMLDPLNETELVAAMHSVATNPSQRASMTEKGLEQVKRFTWEQTAIKTLQVYEAALS